MSPEEKMNIARGLGYLIALILSVCVHEFGHALMADLLGDPLPRHQGRLSLNPAAHIDPIGTLVLPVLGFALSIHNPGMGSRVLGWGKPVEISLHARYMSRKVTIRTAHALIAIAGPAMNILFGLLLSGAYVALLYRGNVDMAQAVGNVVSMNIGLFFFNLIPCPPLDGGAVLKRLLPRSWDGINDFLGRYGSYILLLLLMSGALSQIMSPVRHLSREWLNVLAHLVGYEIPR
jgi:Zn-dependent protease